MIFSSKKITCDSNLINWLKLCKNSISRIKFMRKWTLIIRLELVVRPFFRNSRSSLTTSKSRYLKSRIWLHSFKATPKQYWNKVKMTKNFWNLKNPSSRNSKDLMQSSRKNKDSLLPDKLLLGIDLHLTILETSRINCQNLKLILILVMN